MMEQATTEQPVKGWWPQLAARLDDSNQQQDVPIWVHPAHAHKSMLGLRILVVNAAIGRRRARHHRGQI